MTSHSRASSSCAALPLAFIGWRLFSFNGGTASHIRCGTQGSVGRMRGAFHPIDDSGCRDCTCEFPGVPDAASSHV